MDCENNEQQESDRRLICEEYLNISSRTNGFTRIATRNRNVKKNRYNSVLALDSSRVVLFGRDPNRNYDGNYINANYVSNVNNTKKFIATQAPIRDTILDFWHMIYCHSSRVIIMLTD